MYKQHMDSYQTVGGPPPAGRGYFSNAHHELNKMNSPLKCRNTVLYNFGNGKWKK
jgi:hypothetical protein